MSTSALLPAASLALTAVGAKGAPRVRIASTDGSAWSLAWTAACTEGMLVPSTYRFSMVPEKVFLAPAQRCSWPTLPCSCRTQIVFLRPRLFSSVPTASPAISSSWPMWVSAPYAADWADPELTVITGMPALTALPTTSLRASGLARLTTIPSTFWSMAFCTNCACCWAWSSWA